jgi:predicted sulfurtransferase
MFNFVYHRWPQFSIAFWPNFKLVITLPVAVYCKSGRRSRNAANILVKQGYKVYNLDLGITGWIADGKPVVKQTIYINDAYCVRTMSERN